MFVMFVERFILITNCNFMNSEMNTNLRQENYRKKSIYNVYQLILFW